MYRETMGLVKGIGIGMAAAAAVTMIGAKMMKDNKNLRRSVHLDDALTAAPSHDAKRRRKDHAAAARSNAVRKHLNRS